MEFEELLQYLNEVENGDLIHVNEDNDDTTLGTENSSNI